MPEQNSVSIPEVLQAHRNAISQLDDGMFKLTEIVKKQVKDIIRLTDIVESLIEKLQTMDEK